MQNWSASDVRGSGQRRPRPRPPTYSHGQARQTTIQTTIILLMVLLLAGPAWAQAIPGTTSKPDATGAYTVKLDIPEQPVSVAAGEWYRQFTWRLPPNVTIRRVRSFIGFDRGNIAEAHVMVLAEDFDLHLRSEHKETLGIYDSWKAERTSYRVGSAGALLVLDLLCQPTTRAPVACLFGVILELSP